jgi:hypothetical protein
MQARDVGFIQERTALCEGVSPSRSTPGDGRLIYHCLAIRLTKRLSATRADLSQCLSNSIVFSNHCTEPRPP